MEQCAIALGISLAEACPFLKVAQFGPQNGGLQGIQAAIESQKFVVILRPAAVVSKDAKAIGKMRIISGDHAAVACATQVLRRKEAETTERSQTSGRLPPPVGSDRLRGIFNNRQPPGLGDLKDCIHLRRQPEQMDWHDCASSSRYRVFNLPRVEIKVIRTDVHQDWPGAKPNDRDFIDDLRHRGITLAIATSASETRTLSTLKRLGLTDHFAVVVTGDDVTDSKPDPTIYSLVCNRLRCEARNSVAIEDAVSGIRAAKEAGLTCIGVGGPGEGEKLRAAGADHVIENFMAFSLHDLKFPTKRLQPSVA